MHERPSRPRARLTALALVLGSLAAPGVARADAPPRLLYAPTVEVPAEASLPADASVLLEITLDETGRVAAVNVLEGVRADVDARAAEAAREMRFAPAERDGRPVAVRLRFRFRLRQAAPRPPQPPQPPSVQGANADAGAGAAGAAGAGAGAGAGANGDARAAGDPSANRGAGAGANEGAAAVPDNPFAQAEGAATARRRGGRRGGRRRAAGDDEPGITVRGRHEPGAATRASFRAEELTTVPGTFGEPTRIVATQPGVARTPFGLGYFVVRGASFENTGFLIDGFPVLVMYHLAAGPAVISSRLVGQLDFYPGGYPLQYGRFSAGVISLETRPPPTDRPRFEFEVDVLRSSLLGVMPFGDGRGTVAVAVRRSYYDFLLPLLTPGVLLNYADGQVRADYRFSDRVRGSFFLFASSDFFDRTEATGSGASVSQARDALNYNFWRAIARLDYRGPGGMSAQLALMFGYDELGVVQADPGRPDRGIRAGGNIMGQRASVRFQTSRALTTTVGIDTLANIYAVNLAFPSPGGFASVPPPAANPRVANITEGVTQLGVAAYIEEVLRAGPLEFTSGLRVEYLRYATQSHLVTDPRAVARVRIAPELTLIASTGIFHQAPPYVALVPQAGNPDLLPQRAWQSSAGAEATLPLQLEARVTGFFNRMWQLPRPTYQIVNTSQGPRRALALSDGEGRAYGLEVLLRRRLTRGVYGWLSYTLSRSERFIGDGPVVPFTYDQTHVLNFAASWDIDARWRVGARFQLATGSPTSLVTGSIFDADSDGFRPQYVAEADRLPTYHQLDVRVDYNFRWGPMRMSAYADVLNVYYARNAEGWIYQYDYADRRPRPGIPIIPTLGIRGEL